MRVFQTQQTFKSEDYRSFRDSLRQNITSEATADVQTVVRRIIEDVQSAGDAALVAWERKLDGATLSPQTLRVPRERILCAHQAAPTGFLALVRRAVANIRAFQESILVKDPPALVRGGRRLRMRYTPIERVGLYVPGGRAVYPSSMLMTLVPALVAGVPRIALACPPRCEGDVNPLILAAAAELGVTEVYRLGGAVAIAAMAIGTASVPAVDKVLGPGNAYVIEAKRRLFGRVGIDSTAGPSEVVIVADDSADPTCVAADLLAQAEHDPGVAVLVTPSESLARQVDAEVDRQITGLSRAEAIRAALDRYGAIIIVQDLKVACEVADDLAAEHVQLMTSCDEVLASSLCTAGAVFVGRASPVAVGDYYAGPSHVLPTGGTARFFGPLSCNDFRKASSLITYDAAALAEDAEDVITFAETEGLTAHAAAVRARLAR